MNRLHVLYDGECALCRRCREWLLRQPAYVPMEFLPFQAPEVPCRFPGIERWHPERELLVVSDAGDVYQGADAWIVCLWALREYREWSFRLAAPALKPLARAAVEAVSKHRLTLSGFLKGAGRG